tara:strand:- start:1375 stop:2856 length:1482 start_codon:yes stop_codon:yes gene_type:complete
VATLRLFASIREIAGTSSLEVDVNNVSDAIAEACAQFGDDFAALVPSCRIWVNGNPAEPTDSVTAQDEIALLPPVSGGSVNYDSLNEQYSGQHIAILSLHTSPLTQPGTGDSGGMNVYIREVASALAHRGSTCTVYVRKWDPELVDEVELESGVHIVHIEAGEYELEKEDLYDIVDDFTDIVIKDLKNRKPVDIIHANYWLSGAVGHKLKHELNIPLVTTFHTLGETKKKSGFPEPNERLRVEMEIVGCSDVVVANSENEQEQLHHLYGANVDRVEIVPLGVEQALFSPGNPNAAKDALGLPTGPILLFIGRLQSLKGVDVAISTLRAMDHENATLVIVGGASGQEGSLYESEIRNLANNLPAGKKVAFIPPQPHHILSTYYRAADIVIVPSRSESFGLVALEAAACGVPVVASSVGGLQNLIEDGKTGLLIEGWDPVEYAQAVDYLLSNPFKTTEIAMNAVDRAQTYTWGQTATRLQEIYQSVLSKTLVECK